MPNSNGVISNTKLESTTKIFWLGFILYTFGYIFPSIQLISFVLGNLIQIFGILLVIYASSQLIVFKNEQKYLINLTIFLLLWSIYIVYRGFYFDYDTIKALLFEPSSGIFLYLLPIIVFFNIDKVQIRYIFKIIIFFGVIFCALIIFFYKITLNSNIDYENITLIEIFSKTLAIPCGFLTLTYKYHSKRKLFISIFVLLLALVTALIKARRGLTFICGSILLASYIFYIINNSRNLYNFLFAMFLFFILGVILLYNIYDTQFDIFQTITSRISDDSRSPVEYCFYQDMSIKDWIIGKGISGEYFCPGIDAPDSIYRTGIESDYLNIILKGGMINLITLLIIVIPAILLGLFRSKNILTKGCAIWLMLWIVYLYPATVVTFNLHYLLVWVCVTICYKQRIRNFTEIEMNSYLS